MRSKALIPGVLGNQQSHQDDSFSDGLLEFPQYTRPREFENIPFQMYYQVIMQILNNGDMNKN